MMSEGRRWIWMAASILCVIVGIAMVEFNGGVSSRVIYVPLIFVIVFNVIGLVAAGAATRRPGESPQA